MNHIKFFILTCLFASVTLRAQEHSVLAEGRWIKMSFTEAGVYKIDWNKVREMGFDPAQIDPRNIAIYGNPGGMLPQNLSEPRPIDLLENKILVTGQSDGVFNDTDYILFYVDSPNQTIYDNQEDQFQIVKNLYSDEINYFFTIKTEAGERIESSPNLGSDQPLIPNARELIFHELDETNLLTSGREWLGEQLNTINSINFDYSISNLIENKTIKVYSSFVTQAFNTTSLNIELNSNTVGTLQFQSIPNSQYAIKGDIQEGTFQLSSDQVSTNSINLKFSFDRNGSNNAIAYLNRFLIDLPTVPSFTGDQKEIYFTPSEKEISSFTINTSNSDLQIWNVSNPSNIQSQQFSLSNNQAEFSTFSDQLAKYQLFSPNSLPVPESFEEVANQNLKGLPTPEFLIITHPNFISEAQRLADFRQSHDNMSVQVVTTEAIYNEFSSGRQDVTAIRDFLKSKFGNGSTLKYALFFGKGSYDYKNRVDNNSNFVPTYESRNSIHPLLTYSSDDYFGFLEDHEGEWIESNLGDHNLDIGLGRIPARTLQQAKKAVDKIILYQTNTNTFGDWKSKILFVADDGDRNIHQRDADQLATLVDTTYQDFQIDKLYLDSFKQERIPNGEFSKDAEKALIDAVNEGRLIINFTGHGAEFGWMQERILTFDLMNEWRNTYKLPFLITATCEFGRNDDPNTESGAERLIFKNVGGAIGLLTTTRPVFSSTNYRLNQALYATMLKQQSGKYQRLGDVVRFTKNNSLQGSLNRNFILLGDPSMRLTYPEKQIHFNEINGQSLDTQDTLKALQPVIIKGWVNNNNQIDNLFNGKIDFSLFDKSQSKITIGSENDPFEFTERDRTLFRGEATVKNGEFEIQFIVPRNINYAFGEGKMIAYATENNLESDALGSSQDFILGGTYEAANTDLIPPIIRIFLNDTTSEISGTYQQDLTAIMKFYDESGINISDAVLGQNINLVLNDNLVINLNNQYQGYLDNFKKGTAEVQLKELNEGYNYISVTARDIHGNSTTETIEFLVIMKTSFISEIKLYPNPFIDETIFSVQHSLKGENLEINVEILNSGGQLVQNLLGEILSAEENIEMRWDGKNQNNQKLEAGIYIYTFNIASKTTGKSDFVRGKLIISN